MGAVQGHQARMAFDDDATFDASSYRIDFVSETLSQKTAIISSEGIRGTKAQSQERTRLGNNDVSGTIVFNPSPLDIDQLFERIMGGTKVASPTNTIDFVEALESTKGDFFVKIDKVGDIYQYGNCKVNRATLRGTPGQLIEFSLDIISKAESKPASFEGTIPALGTAANDAPYVVTDSSEFTMVGSDRLASVLDFEITIDNFLTPRYTIGSTDATDILENDRLVTVNANVEFSASSPTNTDLLDQALAGSTATIILTNGNYSAKFVLGTLQSPSITPGVNGKGEVVINIQGVARKTGSTAELVVTNDSTT